MNVAHTDGGNRSAVACSAAVIFCEDEQEVHERHALHVGEWTNNHAEYHGVLLALRTAHELGLEQLRVFSDSQLIVNHLNGKYQCRSDQLRPLMHECLRLGTLIGDVAIRHVRRERNRYADAICNLEMDRAMKKKTNAWEKRLNSFRRFPPTGVAPSSTDLLFPPSVDSFIASSSLGPSSL